MSATSNTIICGAGIIGLSTAYYLSHPSSSSSTTVAPSTIYLLDSCPIPHSSASGNAGGFLARDWFGPATASLGALSFDLHKKLAEEQGGREKWGYSRGTSHSLLEDDVGPDGDGGGRNAENWILEGRSRAEASGVHKFSDDKAESVREGPRWLSKMRGYRTELIGDEGSTAQVDPRRLCDFLLEECKARGVQVLLPAKALSVSKDLMGELASCRVAKEDTGEEMDLPCTRLILTAGAWTPEVFQTLFPKASVEISIDRLAGHSVVLRSPRWGREHEVEGCSAVFATEINGFSPELFSRMGGEIYIAGINDSALPLPKTAADARPDAGRIEKLRQMAQRTLGIENQPDDLELVRSAVCYRPIGPRGSPLLSRIPDSKLGENFKTRSGGDGGVFVSAGHGPWGISMSLGTGKCLAELVQGQQPSADLSLLERI